jgi:hypothetical protein
MGKAARNRRIRRQAVILYSGHQPNPRSIARALRRHGRMPITFGVRR